MEAIPNNLSEFTINDGVLIYTGRPSVIVNLNSLRDGKLRLTTDVELKKLVQFLNNEPNPKDISSEDMAKWLKEGTIIKKSELSEDNSINPFFKLYREYLSTKCMNDLSFSLNQYHKEEVLPAFEQFDEEEITLSHVYREPHPALNNMSYGERLAMICHKKGILKNGMKILEVGGGTGILGNNFLNYIRKEMPDLYNSIEYTFLDLSPVLLDSQRRLNRSHKKIVRFLEGDIEGFDFAGDRFDLLISNEMIADLNVIKLKKVYLHGEEPPESLKDDVNLLKRLGLDFQDAFKNFLVNIGAIRFILKLDDLLDHGGRAIIVEYGEDNIYPCASVLKRHIEYSIHFGHVIQVIERIGLKVETMTAMEFLGFIPEVEVIDLWTFLGLREHLMPFFGKTLPYFSYIPDQLRKEIGDDFFNQIKGMKFRTLAEAKSPVNPQDFKVLFISKN